jgi:hypothetical protein
MCLALAAFGVLAMILLEPALAGAQQTSPASPPAAAPTAQPPASAEKPQQSATPGAAAPAAPAATPEPMPGVETKPPVTIVYLGKRYDEPLPLSYAEKPIFDKGIQGARLIIKEANQAGRFVGNSFQLVEAIIPPNGDIVAKARALHPTPDTCASRNGH